MKTRILLATLAIATLAAINATATENYISPRAKDNQITAANTGAVAAADRNATVPPRALDNQSRNVVGTTTGRATALTCAGHMTASPKEIQTCADKSGATMSCCSVAAAK